MIFLIIELIYACILLFHRVIRYNDLESLFENSYLLNKNIHTLTSPRKTRLRKVKKTGQLRNLTYSNCYEKSKFTEAQIAFSLQQAETEGSVEEVCREMGIHQAIFYN